MAGDGPLLEARKVGRRVAESGDWLLREIEWAIHAGDRVALIGPSGSGKTLLLRTLAALDPIDCGEIAWRGHHVLGNQVPAFRQNVIYVQQRPALIEGSVHRTCASPIRWRFIDIANSTSNGSERI